MASRIPRSIQQKVILKWFEGKSRDVVARECKISSGSATGIIQGCRRKDREFDLLRVVAVHLRQRGLTVEDFAPLLRCRELIKGKYSDSGKSIEMEEEEIDSLIETLSVFCFNKNMTVPEFGNEVLGCSHTAEEIGVPLCDLPVHISNLKKEAISIQAEVNLLSAKKEQLLKYYKISESQLNEISSYSPYLPEVHSRLKEENRELKEELMKCRIKIKNAEFYKRAEEIKSERKSLGGYLAPNKNLIPSA